MAISKDAVTPHGFLAVGAYHKIDNLRLIGKSAIAFNVVICKSQKEAKFFNVLSFECPYDIDGKNPIAQGYDNIKARIEFDGGVDV